MNAHEMTKRKRYLSAWTKATRWKADAFTLKILTVTFVQMPTTPSAAKDDTFCRNRNPGEESLLKEMQEYNGGRALDTAREGSINSLRHYFRPRPHQRGLQAKQLPDVSHNA